MIKRKEKKRQVNENPPHPYPQMQTQNKNSGHGAPFWAVKRKWSVCLKRKKKLFGSGRLNLIR